MKTKLITIMLLAAVAGCSPQDNNTTSPRVEAVAPVEAKPCPKNTGYQPFFEGFAIEIPYHLRSDRLVANERGQRRRVIIEYLEGDLTSAYQAVATSLADAGFQEKSKKDLPDGAVQSIFYKKGVGLVYVKLTDDAGKNPSNPAAEGLIQIGYPTGKQQLPALDQPSA